MKVDIYSRKNIEELKKSGFPEHTAVISFYTDRGKSASACERVYYGGVCDTVFYVAVPDIDVEILSEYGYTPETYLDGADELANFIYQAKATLAGDAEYPVAD